MSCTQLRHVYQVCVTHCFMLNKAENLPSPAYVKHTVKLCNKSLFTTFSHAMSQHTGTAMFCFVVDWIQQPCIELLHAFLHSYLYGSITHAAGRLAHTIIQGNCLVKVRDRKLVNKTTHVSFPCTLQWIQVPALTKSEKSNLTHLHTHTHTHTHMRTSKHITNIIVHIQCKLSWKGKIRVSTEERRQTCCTSPQLWWH